MLGRESLLGKNVKNKPARFGLDEDSDSETWRDRNPDVSIPASRRIEKVDPTPEIEVERLGEQVAFMRQVIILLH